VLGSIGTAIYRSQVADAVPAGRLPDQLQPVSSLTWRRGVMSG
jgi:hypothetical protein